MAEKPDGMEELKRGMEELKRRLEEAEQNTYMAATYGKKLLDENFDLHTKLEETVQEYIGKLEALEQEKHVLTLKLETKLQNEQSIHQELEQLREQQAKQIESKVTLATQHLESEVKIMNKRITRTEADLESERSENQQNNECMKLMEAQLKEAQERLDMYNTSIHEVSTDESTATMQSQIMTLTCEKQELETQVSSLGAQLKSNKLKFCQAEKGFENLQKEMNTIERVYKDAIEKNKEQLAEFRMEIEAMKQVAADPNKKGNSLFAEVEDQRQAMEKQLKDYKSKYNIVNQQCDMKTQQVSKMKIQLANLLSLSSTKADAEYLGHLEESLSCARSQLDTLTKQCQNSESKPNDVIVPRSPAVETEGTDDQGMTTFFKNMYVESLKKAGELDQDLKTAQFDKVALSDRILQLQRKLRQAESARDTTNSQLIALQVKYEELAAKKGEQIGNGPKNVKKITEKIPGFENTSAVTKDEDKGDKENIMPLKEQQVNEYTLKGAKTQSKDEPHSSKDEASPGEQASNTVNEDEQKNNIATISCAVEPKKKTKKAVRINDTAAVLKVDGEVLWRLKVKDTRTPVSRPTTVERTCTLVNVLERVSLLHRKVERTRDSYYVRCSEDKVEEYFRADSLAAFEAQGFKIICPQELKAHRTIFLKGFFQFRSFSQEEIKKSIEDGNENMEVESVMKIANSPKTLKVRFPSIAVAKSVAENGITILCQRIVPSQIKREAFARIDPCRRCYKYSHGTPDCPNPNVKICSECGEKGHIFKNCTSTTKKCLNCDGDHRTLSAKCPVRKQLSREKSKEIMVEQEKEESENSQAPENESSSDPNPTSTFVDSLLDIEKSCGYTQPEMTIVRDGILSVYRDVLQKKDTLAKENSTQLENLPIKAKDVVPVKVYDELENAVMEGVYKASSKTKKEKQSAAIGATAAPEVPKQAPKQAPSKGTKKIDGPDIYCAEKLGMRVFCSTNLRMQPNPRDEDIVLAALAGILKFVFCNRRWSRTFIVDKLKASVVSFADIEVEYCSPEVFNKLVNEDYMPKGLFK